MQVFYDNVPNVFLTSYRFLKFHEKKRGITTQPALFPLTYFKMSHNCHHTLFQAFITSLLLEKLLSAKMSPNRPHQNPHSPIFSEH